MLFFSVGTLQLPVDSQIFMSVSSMKLEHSRSAWSTFLSWGTAVAWAAPTSRMQWHTSPVSYSLTLKAHLIIIKVIKRRKYIMKCTFMIPQGRSAKERFGHSGSSWRAAHEHSTAEGRAASIHSPHTWAPAAKCTWPCTPSCTFPSPVPWELLEPLTISHSGLAEKETGRTRVSGQQDCAWVTCWGTGRGSTQPCHCNPPFLPIPSQLHEFKISLSKAAWQNIKQSSISFSKRSTAHSKAPRAQNPTSTPHLLQWPVTSRSRAPSSPKGFQLSSFLPEGPPQQHRMQDPASAVLHSICKLTTQGRGESAFFSNQRWSDAPFPGVQPPSFKAAQATQACSPFPPFPWRRLHIPTSQPALPQHSTRFLQQREGEQNKDLMMKGSCSQSSFLVLCSDFVPDIIWFYMQLTQSFPSHVHQVLPENVAIIHQVLSFSQLPEEE